MSAGQPWGAVLSAPGFAERGQLVVERETTNRHGESSRTKVTTDIMFSTTPVSGTDRELLPEGLQLEGTRKFFTCAAVELDNVIVYDGANWRIVHLEDWGGYRRLIGALQDCE